MKTNETKNFSNQNNNNLTQNSKYNNQKQKVNSILKNSSAQIGMNSQASNLSWSYLEDMPTN